MPYPDMWQREQRDLVKRTFRESPARMCAVRKCRQASLWRNGYCKDHITTKRLFWRDVGTLVTAVWALCWKVVSLFLVGTFLWAMAIYMTSEGF